MIDFRTVRRQGIDIPQALLQWEGLPQSDATWEDIAQLRLDHPAPNLEDNVYLREGEGDGDANSSRHLDYDVAIPSQPQQAYVDCPASISVPPPPSPPPRNRRITPVCRFWKNASLLSLLHIIQRIN